MSEEWRTKPIVLICAKGHPAVTYLAERGKPEPACPTCGKRSGEKLTDKAVIEDGCERLAYCRRVQTEEKS